MTPSGETFDSIAAPQGDALLDDAALPDEEALESAAAQAEHRQAPAETSSRASW